MRRKLQTEQEKALANKAREFVKSVQVGEEQKFILVPDITDTTIGRNEVAVFNIIPNYTPGKGRVCVINSTDKSEFYKFWTSFSPFSNIDNSNLRTIGNSIYYID